MLRDLVRKMMPAFLLEAYRRKKKAQRNRKLQQQKEAGQVITVQQLVADLKKAGIRPGDSVLVHAAMSGIGFLENGPETFIDALIEAVGEQGNILMPNSPNASFQEEYIQKLSVFDVQKDASALGRISEVFRNRTDTLRSAHPTEPVSARGPLKEWFTSTHFGNVTPYNRNSPYYKLAEQKGKILYVAVTLANAGTSLHVLEDEIGADFPAPVYAETVYEVPVRFPDGEVRTMKTKVHNPEQSKKRRCDGLIPYFKQQGCMREVKIGKATTLVTDAAGMLDAMLTGFREKGITMYEPEGRRD